MQTFLDWFGAHCIDSGSLVVANPFPTAFDNLKLLAKKISRPGTPIDNLP